uniref:Uncharacterized protein n=1 Tax=Canis lupus dingo TaxID=286419 RepID=A0A8C0LQG8_CANLU
MHIRFFYSSQTVQIVLDLQSLNLWFFNLAMGSDGSVCISLNKRYACSHSCRKHCSRFNPLCLCPPM